MAVVYIIHSEILNKFDTGSCLDFDQRLLQHNNHSFDVGFTHRANDWGKFVVITNLEYQQARKIERHVKKMKSRKYISNLT